MNIDHLKDKFDLNELEVSLLEYIKKNQKQLKNITIRQMAKDNFTSTSAIYRLCNKLEFSGYSDMIYHLSSNTHNNAPAQKYENYLPHFIQLLNIKIVKSLFLVWDFQLQLLITFHKD